MAMIRLVVIVIVPSEAPFIWEAGQVGEASSSFLNVANIFLELCSKYVQIYIWNYHYHFQIYLVLSKNQLCVVWFLKSPQYQSIKLITKTLTQDSSNDPIPLQSISFSANFDSCSWNTRKFYWPYFWSHFLLI